MTFDFLTYMENLAKKLVLISHGVNGKKSFFRVSGISSMEELLQGWLNKGSFPALFAVDQPESRLMDRDSSNLLSLNYYYFFVLQKADIASASSRNSAIITSDGIARSILSQLFKDKSAASVNPFTNKTGLRNLNRDSISIKAVVPLADSCYWVWVSFTVINDPEIKFTQSEWIQEDGE